MRLEKKTNGGKRAGKNKTSYSEAEKRAYDAGKAYGAAKKNVRCTFKTEKERKSFSRGYKRATGGKK